MVLERPREGRNAAEMNEGGDQSMHAAPPKALAGFPGCPASQGRDHTPSPTSQESCPVLFIGFLVFGFVMFFGAGD